MTLRIFIFFAAVSFPAIAAEVLKVGSTQRVIAISHEQWRRWGPKDYICVFQGARELACGVVAKVTPKGAIVKLDSPNSEIVVGNTARLATKPSPQFDPKSLVSEDRSPVEGGEDPNRKPAMKILNSIEPDRNIQEFGFNLSGGISAGPEFFVPLLNFQRTISPAFALGFVPTYFRVVPELGSTASGLGLFLTGNYYGSDFYRGLWIQGGMGTYLFSATTGELPTETARVLAFMATGGWRGYWDHGLNIGVAAGFQYLGAASDIVSLDMPSGFQPMLLLDLGFNF